MPITQDRMISLLNAALDYQHAFAAAKSLILNQATASAANQITPSEALTNIANFIAAPESFLSRPIETTRVIAVEHHHFKTHGRDNRRAARRAEQRRRAAGIEPLSPSSFSPSSFLPAPEALPAANPAASPSPLHHQATPPPSQEKPPPSQEKVDLSWDPSDVENAFSSLSLSEALTGSRQPIGISQQAAWQASIEGANEISDGHQATLSGDQIRCICGFIGGFEAWEHHLSLSSEAAAAAPAAPAAAAPEDL